MNWLQLLSPKRFGDKTDVEFSAESRSRFEQDYDRLIFSHPFRKLQDKTQVFPLPEDDFVHTRLTHSLEVSSVGRSLGKAVGEKLLQKYPELGEAGYTLHDFGGIVAAASLAHDLGNPPFGHSGETAISSFFTDSKEGQLFQQLVDPKEWTDLTSFEGNAQGFRILNDEEDRGLKLTYASMGAFTKYPKSSFAPADKERKSQKKYGYTRSNLAHFRTIADEMGLISLSDEAWCRHPLAFLVEAADDICYNIIDLEDGCRLGLVPFDTTKNLLAKIIDSSFSQEKLDKMTDINQKLGTLRAMAIGKLIHQTVELFLQKEEEILQGKFDKALTDYIPSSEALEEISVLSVEKIYRCRQVMEREAGGFEIIGKLMESFCLATYSKLFDSTTFTPRRKSAYRLLPAKYQDRLEREGVTPYEALLIVMDYVSSLTDSYAIKLYKILHGFSLPMSKA